MTLTERPALPNGVDIDAIRTARASLAETPELARFEFRATNRWVDGVHSRSTFDTYHGVGEEHAHRQPFTYDADHPELFAAPDNGPTPVEFLLHGLAGCLTAGIASVAANRGIRLHSVSSTVAGEMDMRGVLGTGDGVRNGYTRVHVRFHVEGDASREQLDDLVRQSMRRSAVFDVLTNGVTVDVEVAGA